jgi:hypothetical protein
VALADARDRDVELAAAAALVPDGWAGCGQVLTAYLRPRVEQGLGANRSAVAYLSATKP